MSNETVGPKIDTTFPEISRRKFGRLIRYSAVGAATVIGGDLINREILTPNNEQQRFTKLYLQLEKQALRQYPSIFLIPARDMSAEAIAKVQAKTVITGYDANGEEIILGLLGPEELIQALGYTDERLDERGEFRAYDKNGRPTPLRPDGTQWNLRERIHERPDIYNEELRRKIDQENRKKREDWINKGLQQTSRPKSQDWTLTDTLQLLSVPAIIAAGALLARRTEGISQARQFDDLIRNMKVLPYEDRDILDKQIRPHLQFLIETYKKYALKDLKFPRESKEITAYLINNGHGGALDALAIHFLAKRLGIKAKIIAVDNDGEALDNSSIEWALLADVNIVNRDSLKFQQGDYRLINFEEIDPSNPNIIVIKNADYKVPQSSLRETTLRAISSMDEVRRNGADARLIITSNNATALPLLKQLSALRDPGNSVLLRFMHDNVKNAIPDKGYRNNDKYISVLGY